MTETKLTWVIASHNPHKAEELSEMLTGVPVEVVALGEDAEVPEETGKTLLANAQIKARAAARLTGLLALGDDSGLEVDALGGEPGVLSARYAGEDASFADNNQKLLEQLTGIHDVNRRARFRCVLVLASPAGKEITAEGRIEGFILAEPRGEGGFGYDPIFIPEGMDRSLAELSGQEKNKLSHRALAVENLKVNLERLERWEP